MNSEKLTMSIKEVADVLSISTNTAYSLARSNELPVPVIYIGPKRMVVSRVAVDRLLQGKTQQEGQ